MAQIVRRIKTDHHGRSGYCTQVVKIVFYMNMGLLKRIDLILNFNTFPHNEGRRYMNEMSSENSGFLPDPLC